MAPFVEIDVSETLERVDPLTYRPVEGASRLLPKMVKVNLGKDVFPVVVCFEPFSEKAFDLRGGYYPQGHPTTGYNGRPAWGISPASMYFGLSAEKIGGREPFALFLRQVDREGRLQNEFSCYRVHEFGFDTLYLLSTDPVSRERRIVEKCFGKDLDEGGLRTNYGSKDHLCLIPVFSGKGDKGVIISTDFGKDERDYQIVQGLLKGKGA